MHLLGKYEILEAVEGRTLRTFKARQVSTGRIVLCHDLSSGPNVTQLVRLVVRYLRSAAPRDRSLILDMIEEGGSVCLITEPLPGSSSLTDWLETVTQQVDATVSDLEAKAYTSPDATKPSVSQSALGEKKSVPSEPVGEFTRMFQAPGATKPGEPAQVQPQRTSPSAEDVGGAFGSPVPAPQPAVKPSGPAPSPPAEQGEFTQLFRAPDATRPAGPEQSPPLEASPAAPDTAGPFGASKLDKVPAPQPAVKPSGPPPSPSTEQGEFTQLFRAPDATRPTELAQSPPLEASPAAPDTVGAFGASKLDKVPAPTVEPAGPAPSPPTEPGGFTQLFRAPDATRPAGPAPSPPLEASPAAPDTAGAFGASKLGKVPTPQPTVEPLGPAPSPPTEPGEFTELFRAPSRNAGSARAELPRVVPEKAEPSGESGEFTRVFESYKVGGPLPSSLREPSAVPGRSEVGEFTKIFQSSDRSSGGAGGVTPSIPVAAQPAEQEGDFTRIFGSGSAKSAKVEPVFPSVSQGAELKSRGGSAGVGPSLPSVEAPKVGPARAGADLKVGATGPPAPKLPDAAKPGQAASAPPPKLPAAPLPSPPTPKVSVPTPVMPKPPARPSVAVPPAPKLPQTKLEAPKPPVPPVAAPPAPRPLAPPAAGPSAKVPKPQTPWPLILILSGLALAVVALILLLTSHH